MPRGERGEGAEALGGGCRSVAGTNGSATRQLVVLGEGGDEQEEETAAA
jgi:hypothetical protein